MLGPNGGATTFVAVAMVVGLTRCTKGPPKLESMIADELHAATTAREAAREHARQRDGLRSHAFKLFDTYKWAEGERLWPKVEALASQEYEQYRIAWGHIEKVLSLDPNRAGLRTWIADLTFERLLRAEKDRRVDLTDELAQRLAVYDNDRYQAELGANPRIELELLPTGARVWSERPGAPRQLIGQAPLPALTLPTGSVVLSFEAPGHVAARLPVLISPREALKIRVVLPD